MNLKQKARRKQAYPLRISEQSIKRSVAAQCWSSSGARVSKLMLSVYLWESPTFWVWLPGEVAGSRGIMWDFVTVLTQLRRTSGPQWGTSDHGSLWPNTVMGRQGVGLAYLLALCVHDNLEELRHFSYTHHLSRLSTSQAVPLSIMSWRVFVGHAQG